MRRLALLVVLAPAVASASPADHGSIAVAVNSPASWPGIGHAGSLYVGLDRHHAIRANLARYEYGWDYDLWKNTIGQGDYDSGTEHDGSFLDVGASWTWFPNRLYKGFMLDVGLLRRDQHSIDTDRQNEWPAFRERSTTTYAVRVMAGYSHPLGDWGFIAWALGGSDGYRIGHETERWQAADALMTYDVSGWDKAFEFYLRFGVVMR